MSEHAKLGPAQEYAALRDELNQSRQYVFERPIVIVGAGIGVLTAADVEYGAALPAFLTGLLLFNYWFTINRLMSASRIVAYIQVVLEGDAAWKGWETSLREYRMWIKDDPKEKRRIVEGELDHNAVPDALMYYPPIYQLHIVLVGLCMAIGLVSGIKQPTVPNTVALVVLVLLATVFAGHCWKWKPSKMRGLIERNVVIWQHALGIKRRTPEDDMGDSSRNGTI